MARTVRAPHGAGQAGSGMGGRRADESVPTYLPAARRTLSAANTARTGRDGAQSFFRRARHGAARPRAEADRGAGRGAAQGNCDHRGRDGGWADGALEDEIAARLSLPPSIFFERGAYGRLNLSGAIPAASGPLRGRVPAD